MKKSTNRGQTPLFPFIVSPKYLDHVEDRVRCLSYICSHLADIVDVPFPLRTEVIWVQYTGEPYPALNALFEDYSDPRLEPSLDLIEKQIDNFVAKTTVEKLLELSMTESLTWKMVLEGK